MMRVPIFSSFSMRHKIFLLQCPVMILYFISYISSHPPHCGVILILIESLISPPYFLLLPSLTHSVQADLTQIFSVTSIPRIARVCFNVIPVSSQSSNRLFCSG